MPGPTVIENPILNGPFSEPTRHFRFDEDGITDEIVEGRRPSSYFVPIPKAKKKGGQLQFETEWTADRIEESRFINQVRERISRWRSGGWQGVTPTTRSLLEYWTDAERERPLFFCQVEALETAIYITEVARKQGDTWIENHLREMAEDANPGLFRIAHKMATGTGKTVVMAMLIAWHTLNKAANPQDGRFADAFLLVAPGITIKDRLRVSARAEVASSPLRPNDLPPAAILVVVDLAACEPIGEGVLSAVALVGAAVARDRYEGPDDQRPERQHHQTHDEPCPPAPVASPPHHGLPPARWPLSIKAAVAQNN